MYLDFNTIMQVRWKNALKINSFNVIQFSSFHSTPIYFEKWENKWNSAFRQSQHSKNYIKYTTRQKRADAKRALKDILFKGGSSKITIKNYFVEIFGGSHNYEKQEDHTNSSDSKSSSKSSDNRASKARRMRMKRKTRQEGYADDFDAHFERFYEAEFGHRRYTWSFKGSRESYSKYSTNDSEWRNHSNWAKYGSREQRNASDIDSDNEACVIGSSSERMILGLPLRGHLEMEDVKKAFHLSALKWHPDKHQDSSKTMAEEKFKHCVNAYRSLCDALT